MKLSMKNINNFFKKIIALFIGLLITFILLEFFLRIYDPFKFRVQGTKIILPVNLHYSIKNNRINRLDKIIIHTKNSLGFRGQEPPKNFEDCLTIITVGGSTTECFYLSDNNTWPYLLETKLDDYFKMLWVNNAGFDGYSSFGNLMLLRDYIVRLKPKVVLFLIGGNDMGLAAMSDYEEKNIKGDHSSTNPIKRFIKLTANYSKVSSALININNFYKAKRRGMGHAQLNLEKIEKIEMPLEAKMTYKKMHQERYLESFRLRLKMITQICRENAIVPVFITHPALLGKEIDDVTGVDLASVKIHDIDGELYWDVLEFYNDVIRDIGKNENILTIDLAKEMPKSSKYYYDFGHFSNEGAQKVAEIIFKHFYPFLEKKYPAFKKS